MMITEPKPNLPFILVAEDGEDDVFFMRYAFKQGGLMNQHFVAENGEVAIQYLEGAAQYGDRHRYPEPTLLLLDLKMPKVDGFGVLEWLKSRPEFASLPIVVLSSSDEDMDRKRAQLFGADDFRKKPAKLPDLVALVLELCRRWIPGKTLTALNVPDVVSSRPEQY